MFGDVNINDFVGKKIETTLITDDRTIMFWKVDGLWYKLVAIGDCCSYSWYEHCDNADALNGGTLIEYTSFGTDLGNSLDDPYNDTYIQVSMMKFKTDKGYCTVEFRNESNGYYSGWTEVGAVTGEVNVGVNGRQIIKEMKDF